MAPLQLRPLHALLAGLCAAWLTGCAGDTPPISARAVVASAARAGDAASAPDRAMLPATGSPATDAGRDGPAPPRRFRAPADPALPRPLRVACLGDSLTAGARLDDPAHHAWPAQLAWRLPEDVTVAAFAAGGRTLLRAGDTPLMHDPVWRDALAWAPDVAVVLLGTNDTCGPPRDNWRHAADLADDAGALADALRAARPGCQVLLVRPPDMFPGRADLADARRDDLARRAPRLDVLDQALAAAAASRPDVRQLSAAGVLGAGQCADGVHPDPFGAQALADWCAATLRAPGGPLDEAAARLRAETATPGTADGVPAAPAAGATAALDDRPVAPPSPWAPWPELPGLRPVPSAEHRGHAAGWSGRGWFDELERLRALAAESPEVPLVFLGDSITQGLTGADDRRARPGGPRAFDRWHGARGALTLGLSGDRTEHVLWRIEHGALALCDPRLIVLVLGVNDLNTAGRSGADTAAGLTAVLDALAASEPQAHVLLCGPFPCGAPGERRRAELDDLHARLAPLGARPGVTYRDLRPLFVDADGRANERLAGDLIHLTSAGQEGWLAAIEPDVARLLGDSGRRVVRRADLP